MAPYRKKPVITEAGHPHQVWDGAAVTCRHHRLLAGCPWHYRPRRPRRGDAL